MKKTKHILINLTEEEYEALVMVASKEKRNLTNMAYLLLIEPLVKQVGKLTKSEEEEPFEILKA